MERDQATARIETVVERAIAGGAYAGLVEAIWVFGSYQRGALTVADVDLLVEHRTSAKLSRDTVRCFSIGGNPYLGLDRELRDAWRNVNIVYGAANKENLEAHGGFAFTLVWRRPEQMTSARFRLAAIEPDPAAGRAPREVS